MSSETKNRAVWLQLFIEEHFGIDIASYTTAELDGLAKKLTEFTSLPEVDTDELQPADEYTEEEIEASGYKASPVGDPDLCPECSAMPGECEPTCGQYEEDQ